MSIDNSRLWLFYKIGEMTRNTIFNFRPYRRLNFPLFGIILFLKGSITLSSYNPSEFSSFRSGGLKFLTEKTIFSYTYLSKIYLLSVR